MDSSLRLIPSAYTSEGAGADAPQKWHIWGAEKGGTGASGAAVVLFQKCHIVRWQDMGVTSGQLSPHLTSRQPFWSRRPLCRASVELGEFQRPQTLPYFLCHCTAWIALPSSCHSKAGVLCNSWDFLGCYWPGCSPWFCFQCSPLIQHYTNVRAASTY